MEFERANTPAGVHPPSTHFLIFYLAFVMRKELWHLLVQQHMHGSISAVIGVFHIFYVCCIVETAPCKLITAAWHDSIIGSKSQNSGQDNEWKAVCACVCVKKSRNGWFTWLAAVLLCSVVSTTCTTCFMFTFTFLYISRYRKVMRLNKAGTNMDLYFHKSIRSNAKVTFQDNLQILNDFY